ncbi:MAG: alpha/beta fold hydrolase [Thermoplasmatota archaeon]
MKRVTLMDGRIQAAAHVASPERWIICSHGLYSSMASDKYRQLAEMASQRDISLLRFDHRGCGDSGGDFAGSTLTRRVEDMQAAVRWVRRTYDGDIALFGSSFGGMVSILAADSDIKALALMSTPHTIEDDPGLDDAFMDDLQQYNLLEAIAMAPPVLVMHGQGDELVPVAHARALHRHAGAEKKLALFDTDHRFSDTAARHQALTLALDWISARF